MGDMNTPKTDAKICGMGHSMKRKEDPRFIRGQGQYIDDFVLPGMLYMDIVRSPHAHAKIKKIDTSKALKIPGVLAVIDGPTLAKYNLHWMPTLSSDTQMVLPIDEVMYQAQEVCAVIATERFADLVLPSADHLPGTPDYARGINSGEPGQSGCCFANNLGQRTPWRVRDQCGTGGLNPRSGRQSGTGSSRGWRLCARRYRRMDVSSLSISREAKVWTEALSLSNFGQRAMKVRNEMACDVFAFIDGQAATTHERARLALREIPDNRECLIESDISHGGLLLPPLSGRRRASTSIENGRPCRISRVRISPGVNLAHVLKEFDHLALELKLSGEC